MEQKKAPLDLGLKMLENYKIVRHNEFRFISSEFGFVNSFLKWNRVFSRSDSRIV